MRARGVATWGDSEDAFTAVPEALALHGVCDRGGLLRGGVVGGSAPGGEAGGEAPGLPRIFHRGGSAPGGEASANSLMSKVSLGVMECRGGVAGPGSPTATSMPSSRGLWAGVGDVGGSPARAPRPIEDRTQSPTPSQRICVSDALIHDHTSKTHSQTPKRKPTRGNLDLTSSHLHCELPPFENRLPSAHVRIQLSASWQPCPSRSCARRRCSRRRR